MAVDETNLDDVLNRPGPQQLDHVGLNIEASSLLYDDGVVEGSMMDSLQHQRSGSQIDGVGQFAPGSDAAHNLDVRATLASDRPMARKVNDQAAPGRMHVVLDQPDRHEKFTGDYASQRLGSFALSLCGRISEVAGSELAVYQSDGETAGLLYEGYAIDLYDAFNQLEGITSKRLQERAGSAALSDVLQLVNETIDYENDALFVVSDYLDEYDDESGSYGWEGQLRQLHEELDDRLWAMRITSPAQQQYPDFIIDALSHDTITKLNRDFAALSDRKQQSLDSVLTPFVRQKHGRLLTVDTFRDNNEKHPVQAMSKFVLGETA